jgi:DNA-binding HxlR family transcriptional regulator
MGDQLDFFAPATDLEAVLAPTPGRVHHGGLVTERKAAERVSMRAGSQKALLLIELAKRGDAIPHDIYRAANCLYPHVATTRLTMLAKEGLVERTAEQRPTLTDSAHVWRITARGVEVARQLAAKQAA